MLKIIRKDVGAECRHVMRPSVQLLSVYYYSGAFWRTSLYLTMTTLITVEVTPATLTFDLLN